MKRLVWWVIPSRLLHDRTRECHEWDHDIEESNMVGAYRDEWCPVCHLFGSRQFQGNPLVYSRLQVSHEYSDAIWESSWNVRYLYMGSPNTNLARRLRTEFRQVTSTDILHSESQLHDLGTPRKSSDIRACEETLRVLDFLKMWISPEHSILIEDEF